MNTNISKDKWGNQKKKKRGEKKKHTLRDFRKGAVKREL